MAKLSAFVKSLDAVPENLRELYVEQEDGRFKLDADGVEDIGGLKSALQKEREQNQKLRTSADKYKNVDPDKYNEMIAAADEAERKRLTAEGNFTALTEQMKTAHKTELERERAEKAGLLGEIERRAIDGEAIVELTAAKGKVKLLLPHVKSQARVRKTDTGVYVTEVIDGNGNVRIADGAGTPMTIKQLVAEMKGQDDFAGAFMADDKSGGGAPSTGTKGGAPSGKPHFLSRADALDPAKYRTARDAADKAGVALDIEPQKPV